MLEVFPHTEHRLLGEPVDVPTHHLRVQKQPHVLTALAAQLVVAWGYDGAHSQPLSAAELAAVPSGDPA